MLVGAVGRSDLVAPDLTVGLIGDQHRSVRRLADMLPGATVVAPTHGAGSFCSTTPAGDSTSTIDVERRDNPALRPDVRDRVVAERLASATAYPTYDRDMAPINLRGGDPMPTASVPEIAPATLDGFDGEVIDLRPLPVSAAGRIPGSIPIPMADDVAGYAAWIVPWGTPLVLVGTPGEVSTVVTQLARIGHDRVVGAVTDDLEAWVADGRPLDAHDVVTAEDLLRRGPEQVLDVRDPVEFRDGAVPGSVNIHVASLPRRLDELPSGETWVYCASGYRAAMAAGLLARSGRRPVLVTGDPVAVMSGE
jgi:rhodanese-related sulfurtransferase